MRHTALTVASYIHNIFNKKIQNYIKYYTDSLYNVYMHS